MSRRERDSRDSRSKRLHSRFDREPSPKNLKRHEKPEANVTHSSHRHWNMAEVTSHEQKQRHVQDYARLEVPPVSSTSDFHSAEKNLERKVDNPPVGTKQSSDNREVPRSRSFYQHDDRSSTGQGGQNLSRRPIDHRRFSDRARDESNNQPKKDERSQPHTDEKTSVWRHDRFYEMESGAPPVRKRPAFREQKAPSELEIDAAATGTDKTKVLSTFEPSELPPAKRERTGFHSREPDKPNKHERRGDGFYHNRGEETRRNAGADQPKEGYGAMRGRSDRLNIRFNERGLNHVGGFEVEKWKHDLFDEANQSPPPKNEEEQIAKVEALLAS